ncbi:MAG TPA: hypothetical protein VIN61_16580 [Gammaproteobacteria bacterium]
MRPSLVVLGFVLGSAASITFSLFGVAVVYLVLRGDHPRLDAEFPAVLSNLAIFAALTAVAAASFYGHAKRKAWRGWASGVLVAGIAWVGWHYWP